MNVDGDRLADIDYEEDAEEIFENEDEDEVMSDAESEEKDETELELERLVFGDTAGFKEELKTFGTGAYPGVQEDSDEDEQAQLATLADADVR
jgi:U3 small nucleolar RNA-associated protein 18